MTSFREWFAGLAMGNLELMKDIEPDSRVMETLRVADGPPVRGQLQENHRQLRCRHPPGKRRRDEESMNRFDVLDKVTTMAPYKHFIVLSGEAGAGKDSTANVLVDHHGYRKVSLSDEMKRFCMCAFGWTHGQMFGPSSLRNAPDPKWARPCAHCRDTVQVKPYAIVTCPKCNGEGKINDNSPRRVLQLLGDEWGRQMIHPDIWTMVARPGLENLLSQGTRIVINDARFENDRTNLTDWLGAKLVDVRSVNSKDDGAAWRKHASELSRPTDDQVHYVLHNDEEYPFPGLRARVADMLHALYGEGADA